GVLRWDTGVALEQVTRLTNHYPEIEGLTVVVYHPATDTGYQPLDEAVAEQNRATAQRLGANIEDELVERGIEARVDVELTADQGWRVVFRPASFEKFDD